MTVGISGLVTAESRSRVLDPRLREDDELGGYRLASTPGYHPVYYLLSTTYRRSGEAKLLSAEQKEMRRNGIGASEIAAVCGVSRWEAPLDVWMRKATPSRPPLVEEGEETERMRVGRALHEALRGLYTAQTGIAVSPGKTLRHAEYRHILATPHGLSYDSTRGLTIRCVGPRQMDEWGEGKEDVPRAVELQCRQGMAVTGRECWDVAVLLGGTDFRVYTLKRDLELEELLLQAANEFWATYVEGDSAPPEPDPDRRRQYLKALYRSRPAYKCVAPTDPARFTRLCRGLSQVNQQLKKLEREKKLFENDLCEMVGDNYGIESEAGKFLWPWQTGSVAYKAVAQELFGGAVPEYIAEKHRAPDERVVRFYSAY
jgi:putative phage-type endonuclease